MLRFVNDAAPERRASIHAAFAHEATVIDHLDEAITAYERGAHLKKHCEQKLAEAKLKVDKIVFAADGSAATQPADLG